MNRVMDITKGQERSNEIGYNIQFKILYSKLN